MVVQNLLRGALGLTLAWGAAACGSEGRKHDAGSDSDTGAGPGMDGGLDAAAERDAGQLGDAQPGSPDAGAQLDSGPGAIGAEGGTGDGGPAGCDPNSEPDMQNLALAPVPGVGALAKLVFATQAPGSNDWYLVQQTGTIRVLAGGQLRDASFLDVSSQIALDGDGDERGLLGLAFPPDYVSGGKFYVMMSPTKGDDAGRDLVIEYQRGADPYVADAIPAKQLLALPASAPNHNGGSIVFGPDGMLYVGTGDGGGGCNDNQPDAPQQTSSLFGKILRLDPKAAAPYAASGNPFASSGDARVWHYGLRNPFRFGFDRANGDLFIGDVGQVSYEELDWAAGGVSGLNFGWAAYEGNHAGTCGAARAVADGGTPTPPIVEVDRRMGQTGLFADWVSIIAGVSYRGGALPQLTGVHVFGDYTGARMRALRQCGATTSPVAFIDKNCDPNTPAEACFRRPTDVPLFRELTAIVEDHDGEIYFVANRSLLLKVVARQ